MSPVIVKEDKAVLAVYVYSSKRRYKYCALLKRQSVLVLKVGCRMGSEVFKRRLVHSVVVAIIA